MPEKPGKPKALKSVETLIHQDDQRRNIPTAEFQSVMRKEEQSPVRIACERGAAGLDQEKLRRNRDLDPQLVWRGKDEQDWSDLVVQAPPLYIQEKVHPKVLIDDLRRHAQEKADPDQPTLWSDFNGLPSDDARTEFYQHDANWTNRMILGDSLQVMASLAEREGLRGKVQCIYLDPPYGIKFNSNFQWSTTSRDVKDGNVEHITREPEQVKAFRDTWRDGIHSYLTYLRDRLTVARDLLTDSGSIFVQIGDENVHRVRALMDTVFGQENSISVIVVGKTSGAGMEYLDNVADFVLCYAKDRSSAKYRQTLQEKQQPGSSEYRQVIEQDGSVRQLTAPERSAFDAGTSPAGLFRRDQLTSQTNASTTRYTAVLRGREYPVGSRQWATPLSGMFRLMSAGRVLPMGSTLAYVRHFADYPVAPVTNIWLDTMMSSRSEQKIYVVQSSGKTIQRCVLMASDPGDLVLDPTCGSGTTAYVAEQWGRRWITIDTSRVALALARARIMGARYPYYLLADTPEGQRKEGEITRTAPSTNPTHGKIRHGFVYERVPHITLKSIANNTEINVIWDKFQLTLEPLREALNAALKQQWEEWQIPREALEQWPAATMKLHAEWWQQRIARQREIDASIASKADTEYLYDKPYDDPKKVRVAGPFTVESLSPHRALAFDENDQLIDPRKEADGAKGFAEMILENLKTAGVQQAHKEDKIAFTSLTPGRAT